MQGGTRRGHITDPYIGFRLEAVEEPRGVSSDLGAVVCALARPVVGDLDSERFAQAAQHLVRHVREVDRGRGQVLQQRLDVRGARSGLDGVQPGSFVLVGASLEVEVVVTLA
jgi:hypothetical protein